MKRTGNQNVNTSYYWDSIYEDSKRMWEYEKLSLINENDGYTKDGTFIRPSSRMKHMTGLVEGTNVMDIGCGVGALTRMIKDTYPDKEVWGCDISRTAIAYCSERDKDITYLRSGVGKEADLLEGYYDTALAGEVLEHLDDPNDLFKLANRILKQGGRFIISCPKEDMIFSSEHIWFVNEEDIINMFIINGFSNPEFVKLPKMEHMMVILAYGSKL